MTVRKSIYKGSASLPQNLDIHNLIIQWCLFYINTCAPLLNRGRVPSACTQSMCVCRVTTSEMVLCNFACQFDHHCLCFSFLLHNSIIYVFWEKKSYHFSLLFRPLFPQLPGALVFAEIWIRGWQNTNSLNYFPSGIPWYQASLIDIISFCVLWKQLGIIHW